MDKAEVYVPLRERLWLTVLLVSALLLSASASVGMVWRHQRARFYQDRHEAAAAIRQEQLFTKSLLDSLPGIFYLYTYPELRLVLWNKHHETLLGYEAGEIDHRHVTEWHVPQAKDAVLKAIEEVMEKGQGSVEASLLAKDGRQVSFFLTGARFEAHGQLYLMGTGIDITDRKQAQEQIEQQLDELRRWQAVMLGREDRTMAVKREVNELLCRLGEPIRYPSQEQ
jgi:PAS domain S-box-containing protein